MEFPDKECRSSSKKVHWLIFEVYLWRSYYFGLRSVFGTVMNWKGIERSLPWPNRDSRHVLIWRDWRKLRETCQDTRRPGQYSKRAFC